MDMKLEVVVIPVSDVERAKRFYGGLGWRLDVDFTSRGGDYRVVHMTPPHSQCSVLFGKGVTNATPGAGAAMLLAVDDIDVAIREVRSHGAEASEPFHDAGGGLGGAWTTDPSRQAPGHDPQGRSYGTYATFKDPDGNAWVLQEIKERLPGRLWEAKPQAATEDPAALAELLHETSEYHGRFEKTHPQHNWWDWYAPYLAARQHGSDPEQAAAVADRRMEMVLQGAAR